MEEENIQNNTESKSSNMLVVSAVVLVALLVLGGGFYLSSRNRTANTTPGITDIEPAAPAEIPSEPNEQVAGEEIDGVQVINMESGMFYYSPNAITVKKDVPVRVVISNVDGEHDFVIDELNVKSEAVGEGEELVVEFTPTEAGQFEFYCSVGDHKAMGMVGTITVEE